MSVVTIVHLWGEKALLTIQYLTLRAEKLIMLIISYDFSDNKVRTKFAKFLQRFGTRLQYSVFEIKNSQRILDLVLHEIEANYAPLFSYADSIIIFNVSDTNMIKYGNAIHRDKPLVML